MAGYGGIIVISLMIIFVGALNCCENPELQGGEEGGMQGGAKGVNGCAKLMTKDEAEDEQLSTFTSHH